MIEDPSTNLAQDKYSSSGNKLPLNVPVIAILGPTASGKSDLAIMLARNNNEEVVSADSMQIYKGMDIGTGKVPLEERHVRHWGIDLIDPGEPYSAALFQEYARNCFLDINSRGKRALLCGGTGFYVRAAIDDYQFPKGEQVDNPLRLKYNRYAQQYGAQALWDKLNAVDPQSAALIHPRDTKRVVRAFELLAEGLSYATQKQQLSHIEQLVPAIMLGLRVDPQILNARIDNRVDAMIQQGLIGEVNQLLQKGFREGVTAPQAIGYKEIVAYLDGSCTLDEAITAIKIATHRYAKRQRTWFRKDKRITWIDANSANMDEIYLQACDALKQHAYKLRKE